MPMIQKKPVVVTSAVTKKPAAKVIKGKEAEKPVKAAKLEAGKKAINVKEVGRSGSKQNVLIGLLQRSGGATVEEMAKATGWQNHSVLGAISGVLKNRLGLKVASKREERGRVYRIAGAR